MNQTTIDLNNATCLQSANYIGHTHYVNVCNGITYDVAWGNLDWIGCVIITTFMVMLIGFLSSIAISIARSPY